MALTFPVTHLEPLTKSFYFWTNEKKPINLISKDDLGLKNFTLKGVEILSLENRKFVE
jgi:hypothetical protein